MIQDFDEAFEKWLIKTNPEEIIPLTGKDRAKKIYHDCWKEYVEPLLKEREALLERVVGLS